ncbi:MAG: oxidoreductase [Solimonas sp.]
MSAIEVALLGYGYAGRTFHAPLLGAVPGLRLHTVVSSDPARVGADLPAVRVLADAQAACADPAIGLVVIATPNATHAPLARLALEAGKHVVVDKPFALDLAEARGLAELARARGRLLSVFHNRRWDADFIGLRALLEAGALGDVTYFESHFDRYRPAVRPRWREQAGPGGGLWADLGPHLLDQALLLFGRPEALYADLARQRDGAQADDWFHVVLRYARRRVVLHAGSLASAATLRYVVHGTRASFIKHGVDTQEADLKAGRRPGADGWGRDPHPGELTRMVDDAALGETVDAATGDYRRYYAGLRDAFLHGTAPPVTSGEALQVMELLDLAVASHAKRAELPLPAAG